MLFGDILRELLEERRLSQKQLAADLNIAASTMGNYIRNQRQPDFDTVKRFAAYFAVSIDYLLDYHAGSDASPLETELIRVFRTMTEEQQTIFLEQGRAFVRVNKSKKETEPT